MFETELIASNVLTGKKIWLIRHLRLGEGIGGEWDWSFIVTKSSYFSTTARLSAFQGEFSRTGFTQIRPLLERMGFTKATGLRHNNKKQWS